MVIQLLVGTFSDTVYTVQTLRYMQVYMVAVTNEHSYKQLGGVDLHIVMVQVAVVLHQKFLRAYFFKPLLVLAI